MTTTTSSTNRPHVFTVRQGEKFMGHVMAPGHRGRKTWTAQRLQGTAKDVRRYGTGFASEASAIAWVVAR